MNDLPVELYFYIFGYLHLEVLAYLRSVCKKFNQIFEEYKIKELSFYDSSYD